METLLILPLESDKMACVSSLEVSLQDKNDKATKVKTANFFMG